MSVLALPCLCVGVASGDPPEPPSHPTIPSTEAAERFTTSREGRWLDLPAPEETFTFVVFGDRTGGPADGVEVLAQAVDETNLFEPDLVMTVGDLIQGYNTVDPWMAQMREYRGIMDGLRCPWFPVAGNHDVYWRGSGRPPEEHEGRYEEHFGPLWYAFDHKDCRFVVLYTDEPNPDTGERNFGKPDCQRMSPEQLSWLESTLEESSDRRHVFVFLHHPRWIGGGYGDDWERVHRVLADAGNVRAVFAGHIHHMRYDGPRDGIEYVTLATVGGGQSGRVPSAGYLHQFHHVTVRPDGVGLASIPVGTTLDVRDITSELAFATRTVAGTTHATMGRLEVQADGGCRGEVEWFLTNPSTRSVEMRMTPGSDDLNWSFSPDHVHVTVPAGETRRVGFEARRPETARVDEPWRVPTIVLECDVIGESRRYPLVPRTLEFPLEPSLAAPERPDQEYAAAFDGVDDVFFVDSDRLTAPDGPLTLETWFTSDDYSGRRGLVAKTESSEFGIFVSDGRPEFSIHLDGRYGTARGTSGMLEPDRWHHVAGVFDGSEVRLYVDGVLIDEETGSGKRTRNGHPFVIGADVNAAGRPVSHFDGMIDGVRLSRVPRYAESGFTPDRRHDPDEDTMLLLNFDAGRGPWTFDESPAGAHPRRVGDPGRRPASTTTPVVP